MANSRMLLHKDAVATGHPRSQFVERFIERHGVALLSAARRHSASPSDADDAYQRTLEVLLTQAPEGDEQRVLAWALTVVKNEALQEHRRSAKIAHDSYEDYATGLAESADSTSERIVDAEHFGQGREALQRIKPDQMRCMLLRADGLDYDEIIAATGFSYAKVNRCLSEGRKAFRERVAKLDSGAECRRLEGVLSMIADGAASESARIDAEIHLSNCLYCQATLRDYTTAPDRAAAALPIGLVSAQALGAAVDQSQGIFRRIGDSLESTYAALQERLFGHSAAANQASEMAIAKKVTVLAALSASLVAGGVAVEKAVDGGGDQPTQERSKIPAAPQTGAAQESTRRRAAARQRRAQSLSERRRARAATAEDVEQRAAGTPAQENTADPADAVGGSVPDDAAFDAPAAAPPSSPPPGGSNNDDPGLTP